ncbi:hypothetical protein KY290_030148 [Solanum tuberosum]|uniref:Uncharacterized protein n=1 Tax=Solanum tuberosum TaxID=4113 RepID=A0ABQ7UMS7_SOLTU|nr:hypothetical protein KY290_030148 [Solanum tuberosum]
MSCNQPNKLSRTEEETLKEPPSVNIQENASNQITTSTCSSNKAKQLFPPFYAFEKGSTSNTCKAQQNVIPELIYISASTSNACSEQQNVTPKVDTKKGKTLLQLNQLKLRRRQAKGAFVLSTLQSYCTAKAIEERGYIFHLRNLTTPPHIVSQ